jgi:trans-aconitate 2-methyltransferase
MVEATRSDGWNPDQYTRFRAERSRPFFDLVGLLRGRPGLRVVDLGCGTGELTVELHRRLGAAETVGVDSSAAMLAEAAAFGGEAVRFVDADLRAFAARPENAGAFDVVLSNAALQWVPEQAEVIERLTGLLAPGGQIAIQVPANEEHVAHALSREVAGEEPFRTALGGHVRRFSNLPIEEYAALLDRLGYPEQHVRMQVYVHHLPGRDDVVEWLRGALLTDYQKRMTPEVFAAFLARYRAVVMERLEDTRPFFYSFKRILMWGGR